MGHPLWMTVAIVTLLGSAMADETGSVTGERDHAEASTLKIDEVVPQVVEPNLPMIGNDDRGRGQQEAPPEPERYHMLDVESGFEWSVDASGVVGELSEWIPGRLPPEGELGEEGFGPQDWPTDLLPVNDQSFPWSTQCRILYDDPVNGTTYMASGTLIDASHVITAGSVVHQGPGGTWYVNHRIYPAWDGDEDAYGSSTARTLGAINGWVDNGNTSGNMGFIGLSRPVGFLTGWLGKGYWNNNDSYLNKGFHIAGYPSTGCYSGAPDQLYYDFGTWDESTDRRLTGEVGWTCSSEGLTGAASYWLSDAGNRFVMGSHAERCYSCDPDEIYHAKLTEARLNWYRNTMVPLTYPSDEPDYTPLDVDISASDSSLIAGERLSSFSYLLTNASLFNPPNSTLRVEVRLSTNSIISSADRLIQEHQVTWNPDERDSIRISLGQPPQIPVDQASGQYWIGVIVDVDDARSSNNDSSGWDAVPVQITGCQVERESFGTGHPGSAGIVPRLFGTGSACQGGAHSLTLVDGLGGALTTLFIGISSADIDAPFGGHFYIDLSQPWFSTSFTLFGNPGVPGAGWFTIPGSDLTAQQGLTLHLQGLIIDPGASNGVSATAGMTLDVIE